MKFNNRFNHPRPISPSGGVSMTDKQFAKDCDINTILKRYGATGQITCPIMPEGRYGDFSQVGTFSEVLNRVNEAKDYFGSLPADVRSRFGNDPAAFFDFVLNPANREECVKLGLAEVKKPEESAVEVLKRIEGKVTPKGAEPAKDGEGIAK